MPLGQEGNCCNQLAYPNYPVHEYAYEDEWEGNRHTPHKITRNKRENQCTPPDASVMLVHVFMIVHVLS